jgi:hypothetical protein
MTNDLVLDSARKYYDWVLQKQYDDFFREPADFQRLINLASSLFHFHEWLYAEYSPILHIAINSPIAFTSARKFWNEVEKTNSKFGFVRDIANASKHVKLTRDPSRSMSHMANTVIQVAQWDSAQFDQALWDVPYAASKDGSNDVLFDTCAKELFAFWTSMINQLAPL